MNKAAFFGLGNMGLPMALNLSKHYQVACHDASADACARARQAGLTLAGPDATRGADVVFSMLPSGAEVERLLLEKDGLMARAAPQTLFVDCSTTGPAPAKKLAAAAQRKGLAFLDAPVSGGIGGARAATLSFLCGGSQEAMQRARPLLQTMGDNVFWAGESGAGQAAKLCNNMMLSVQMIGACEALALGEKMGLDLAKLSDIMQKSSGGNWVIEKYNPVPGVQPGSPACANYQGGFSVRLMTKDADLAQDAAKDAGAQTPLSALAQELFAAHEARGHGQLDFGSVFVAARANRLSR